MFHPLFYPPKIQHMAFFQIIFSIQSCYIICSLKAHFPDHDATKFHTFSNHNNPSLWIYKWRKLLSCTVQLIASTSTSCLFSDGDTSAILSDVLVFTTGASEMPPSGFDTTPEVAFTEGSLPRANTCSTTLYLPISHEDYNLFKESMDFGILNSPCFGQP